MKKPRIYLDTSIINFYFAEDAPEKMAVTRKFFDEELASGNYETYISLLVLDELEETKDQALRDKLVSLANQYITEVFPLTDEVNAIAAKFVEEGIVPEKYKAVLEKWIALSQLGESVICFGAENLVVDCVRDVMLLNRRCHVSHAIACHL